MDTEYCHMKMVLMIFKLFGLAPWTMERTSHRIKLWDDNVPQTLSQTQLAYSKLGCGHHILRIICGIACGIWVAVFSGFANSDYPNKSQVTWLLDAGLMVSGYIIVTAIRLVLCIKQNTAAKLFNRFMTIDGTIACLVNIRKYKSNGLFFVLLFSTNACAWCLVSLTTYFVYGTLLETFFCNMLVNIIVSWFVVQYVIIVKLIERQFRALNRAILDTANYSVIRSSPSSIFGDSLQHSVHSLNIRLFRQTHISLCEIANDISEIYSLPILLSIPYLCTDAIYAVYLAVIPTILQGDLDSPYIAIDSLAWLIVDLLPIVMLSTGINNTYSEMRKSACIVHELIARASTSRKDKSELRQFSIELYRRDIEFSACSLFSLDCTLLYSITSMVMTYLIIIIRLHLALEVENRLTPENNSATETYASKVQWR